MELKDFKSYQALLNQDSDLAAKVNSVYKLVAPPFKWYFKRL